MKSLSVCVLALALAGTLLTSCGYVVSSEDGSYTFDGEELSKAQVIVLTDADGAELATVTDLDAIDTLVEELSSEDWTLGEVPEDARPALVASLYQEPTETVLGDGSDGLIHLLDLESYPEEGCITLRLAALPVSLDFQVPQSALDALRDLAE